MSAGGHYKFAFLLYFIIAGLLIFGCIGEKEANSNLQAKAEKPVLTFKCPDGQIVTDISQCPSCPQSCNNSNPCIKDYCSKETNYKCIYITLENTTCGSNGICINGSCIEAELNETKKEIENLPSTNKENDNITTMQNISNEKQLFYEDENISKGLIFIINNKRAKNGRASNSLLKYEKNLALLAKKCALWLHENKTDDLTLCYNNFGSFRRILSEVGFEGDYFVFASKAEIKENMPNSNLSEQLYLALGEHEKNLLVNQSVDIGKRPVEDNSSWIYPIYYDSIGVSAICDEKSCTQVTFVAGNKDISRFWINRNRWYIGYEYDFVPNKFSEFKPLKFIVNTKQLCELKIYENKSALEASGLYYWQGGYGDYWDNAYDKKTLYSEYLEYEVKKPQVLFLDCYHAYYADRLDVEVVKDYEKERKNITENELDEIINETKLKVQTEFKDYENVSNFVDAINILRKSLGFEEIKEDENLAQMAQSCVSNALEKKDYSYDSCRQAMWSSNYSDNFIVYYKFALNKLYGDRYYSLSKPKLKINSPRYYFDEMLELSKFGDGEWILGLASFLKEKIGYKLECEDKVCLDAILLGSNKDYAHNTRVRKAFGYGLRLNRWILNTDVGKRAVLMNMMPNMSFEVNSTAKGKFFVFEGFTDFNEVGSFLGSKWVPHAHPLMQSEGKRLNGTIKGGFYIIIYLPDDPVALKDMDQIANITAYIEYHPN